jgi:hypothetical protein
MENDDFCLGYMQMYVLMSLMIVKLKFWTLTVTSPQPVQTITTLSLSFD